MTKVKSISDNLTGPPIVDLPLSQSPVHHLETLDLPASVQNGPSNNAPQSEGGSAPPDGDSERSTSSGGDSSGDRKS